jgi:hypothetical protein
MADALDAPELLDVEMDQLARVLALVADHRGLGFERREAAEPAPAQDRADGRDRHPELAGDGRPGQPLAPQLLDRRHRPGREPGRAAMRPRGAVAQAGRALGGMAVAPLAHRLGINPQGGRHRRHRPAAPQALDHQHSTMAGGSGILMHVRPRLRVRGCVSGNHNLSAQTRTDNLHSNDI